MARRITAKHAAFWLGAVKIADAFDVTIRISTTFEASEAFGDEWELPEPMRGSWNGTARRFHTVVGGGFLSHAVSTPAAASVPLTIIVYQIEGVSASRVFEGVGWAEDAEGNLPRSGMMESGVTLRGYGAPTFVA